MLVFAMVVALLILLIKTIRNWTRKAGALVKAVKISETAQELRNEDTLLSLWDDPLTSSAHC